MTDDEKDRKFRLLDLGDMLNLFIALACLAMFLWLLFGPSPFKGLGAVPKPAMAQPAEVTVTIPEKGK